MWKREKGVESQRKLYGPWLNDFVKSLMPTGDFARALRNVGYDPDHPPDNYSVSAGLRLVELLRSHVYPELPESEGLRKLGRRLATSHIEGAGIGGNLWTKAFPLIGPDLMIKGVEKFVGAGNNFMTAKARKEGDKHWRLTFRGTEGVPAEFIAGTLEYALDLAGAPSHRKVGVSNVGEEQFDLEATW